MSLPTIFSVMFFAAFTMYFFFGLYVLFLNYHSRLHRVFFACCFSLSIWAFSFSIANSAPDYETCLFWRQTASLGWGVCFSILLHFILILTNKTRLLRKKWLYALLYLPAGINVTVFLFSGKYAAGLYCLYATGAGWVNISGGTPWDIWYNFYYLIFSMSGIGLILHWGITAKDKRIKMQSFLMALSYAIAILAGTLTEFVLASVFPGVTPQVAPIISLLPMITILYCIKRYQLMAPDSARQTAEAGHILSEASRAMLYRYLMLTYVIGAFVDFASQYFSGRESFFNALLFGAVVLILGFSLEAVQHLRIGLAYRNILSDIIMTVTIPLMIIKHQDVSAVYALSVPVIFVLISVTFNHSRMLILTGTVTLASLMYLWIIIPSQTIVFYHTDHITRIVIFSLILFIACVINQIYCRRLIQYEEQVKQQELIAEISADFVSVDERNIDDKISSLLERCGRYFHSNHVYIIFFDEINKEVSLLYEWCDEGVRSIAEFLSGTDEDDLPEWLDKENLAVRGIVRILKVQDISMSRQEKQWLEDQQIKSVLTMLLVEKEEVVGFLVFHSVNDDKIREQGTANIVRMIGNNVTHSLLKVAAEKELCHMAYYDTLTDIPNRVLFNKQLERYIEFAKNSGNLVGLIYLDLDLFKTINDIMGHDAGDKFLKQVARNLTECLGSGNTVARFGGDEFLIAIPQADQFDEILEIANRIIGMFNRPLQTDKHEFTVTASMGISVFPFDGNSPEELVKNADLAMYSSKEYGKNKYTICSDELKKEFLQKTELTNSLYHALENNELELFYQPKVSTDGEINGVEALVRWNHPVRGLILPDEFISIAESIGLISAIDQWVVRKACWQTKVWQDMGLRGVKMAFNLSPAQFYRDSFLAGIEKALTENDLDPSYVEVEITESIAYYRPEIFVRTLEKLKEMGLSVAIDDFGSDYSSLSRLRSLPVDRIKIDKQFTDEIPQNKKQGDIVKAILSLGSILGLKVTVEGVETEQQYKFFKENICDEIQGFYFYRPMPAYQIESVLKF